jgi:hypothetical protein
MWLDKNHLENMLSDNIMLLAENMLSADNMMLSDNMLSNNMPPFIFS